MNFQAVWLSIAKCSELMQLISANAPESSKPIKMRLSINFFIFLRNVPNVQSSTLLLVRPHFRSLQSLYSVSLFEVSNRGFYFKTRSRIRREENLFKRHYNQMSQPDNLDGHFCGSNLFPSNSKFEVRYFHYLATSR